MTFGGGMTMVYGGLVALRVGLEVTPLYPALVQLPLYLGRRVLGRQFGGGRCGLLLSVVGHPVSLEGDAPVPKPKSWVTWNAAST